MSTVHSLSRWFSVLLFVSSFTAAQAADGPLRPFRDELFSRQAVLESTDGGARQVIDYQEMRDINGRDEIPEKRVRKQYVDLASKKNEAMETLSLNGQPLETGRAGPSSGQAFTVIFIHGREGDRRLGMNDYSFGGNFNRLKNLAINNGGTYYAPTVRRFDAAGVERVSALIAHAAGQSGGKPVVLACASMGSFICWGISRDAQTVALLKGMVIMGGAADPDYAASAAAKAGLPLWFTHGSSDRVYSAENQESMFRSLLKKGQNVRFTLFQGGTHGTPVRMTDWRQVLNGILGAG